MQTVKPTFPSWSLNIFQPLSYYFIVNFMLALESLPSETLIKTVFEDDQRLAKHLLQKFNDCGLNWTRFFARIDNGCRKKIIDFIVANHETFDIEEVVEEYIEG